MEYRMAKDMMKVAVESDPYHMMNYWGYAVMTLLADDFSQASILDAYMKLNLTGFVGEFPPRNLTESEQPAMDVLMDALRTNNVPLNMASGYRQLFIDSEKEDYLAGTLAALAYKKAGDKDMSISLLKDIIDKDSSNIAALQLYLDTFELERDDLLKQDKDEILEFVGSLTEADPNNPNVLTRALSIYYLYNMPDKTIGLLEKVKTALSNALSNDFITDSKEITDLLQAYYYAHNSALFLEDLSRAGELVAAVDAIANDPKRYIDLRASTKALVYRMRTQEYFQFAFINKNPDTLPASVDDIEDIASSGIFPTDLKLSQNIYRQAVVTGQIRGGEDSEYDKMIKMWQDLHASAKFDNSFSAVVNYSIILLQTEKALMEGKPWEEIFGESGYLNRAYKLVEDVDSEYRVMGMPEIVAYALMKVSMDTPAPLARTSALKDNKIPDSLEELMEAIDESFPNNSPNRLNNKAWMYLALGKANMSQQLLMDAKTRLTQAKLDWLEDGIERAKEYQEVISLSDLEPIPNEIPSSLSFNAQDKMAFDNLDIGWEWKPKVSTLAPRAAFLYRSMKDENVKWKVTPKTSIMSTKSKSYKSTNVASCKLRCMFEDDFECESFTFGFNRCLLHNQKVGDVAQSNKFDSNEDETYYEVPDIPPEETNAYSQLLLGAKAVSSGLGLMGYAKFDEAIRLDPLMSLPRILQAFLISGSDCKGTRDYAKFLLKAEMRMTEYESMLREAVEKLVEGELADAKQEMAEFFMKYNDTLFRSFTNYIDGTPTDNPQIAEDYIQRIVLDMLNSGKASSDDIDRLRQISPMSAMYRILQAYAHYLQGSWSDLLVQVEAIVKEAKDGAYVGFDNSLGMEVLMQLKHYALVQLGRYTEAAGVYNEYKKGNIGAYMYATHLYTRLIIEWNQMPSMATHVTIANPTDPCIIRGEVITKVMNAAKLYTQDGTDSSTKSSQKNTLDFELLKIKQEEPIGDVVSTWGHIADIFYSMGKVEAQRKADNISVSQSMHLAPALYPGLMIKLITPEELKVIAAFNNTEETLGTKEYQTLEALLNRVKPPNRSVTMWLKYQLYRKWRDEDKSYRDESIDAAGDLENQWADGDKGAVYKAVVEYRQFPDPSQDVDINYKTSEENNRLPDWAVYLIIAIAAAILLAIIVSCCVCYAVRNKKSDSEKGAWSGSIYSAGSVGHSENVIPEPGDLVYGGQRNDGFSFH